MEKERVLILSEGFGAGHTQAAYRTCHQLRAALFYHRNTCIGVRLLPASRRWRLGYLSAYKKTINLSAQIYGRLYRSQYKKSLNRLTQLALHRIFYAQTAAMIQAVGSSSYCLHTSFSQRRGF